MYDSGEDFWLHSIKFLPAKNSRKMHPKASSLPLPPPFLHPHTPLKLIIAQAYTMQKARYQASCRRLTWFWRGWRVSKLRMLLFAALRSLLCMCRRALQHSRRCERLKPHTILGACRGSQKHIRTGISSSNSFSSCNFG
jgi:hypothetical protein